jgi:enoyl-CoA hydratase/carnithine racemase
MPSILIEKADGLLIVTLSRAPANALNAAMIDLS